MVKEKVEALKHLAVESVLQCISAGRSSVRISRHHHKVNEFANGSEKPYVSYGRIQFPNLLFHDMNIILEDNTKV